MSAPKASAKPDEMELRPDSWERFEKAVDAAIHGGPKHKPAKKPDDKEAGPKG